MCKTQRVAEASHHPPATFRPPSRVVGRGERGDLLSPSEREPSSCHPKAGQHRVLLRLRSTSQLISYRDLALLMYHRQHRERGDCSSGGKVSGPLSLALLRSNTGMREGGRESERGQTQEMSMRWVPGKWTDQLWVHTRAQQTDGGPRLEKPQN